ncbi:MAG: hypothetical protein ABR591_12595 [Candidatus Velthaea sp.]
MLSYYTVVLLYLAGNAARRMRGINGSEFGARADERVRAEIARIGWRGVLTISVIVLVVLFSAELRLIHEAARQNTSVPAWYRELAFAPLSWSSPVTENGADVTSLLLTGITVSQAPMMYLVYAALRVADNMRLGVAIVVCAGVVMYGIALSTTALVSSDIYAYAAYAKLGAQAYAPGDAHLAANFDVVNAMVRESWGRLDPAPYGPLWLLISHALVGPAPSFSAALLGLRLMEVVAMGVLVAGLRGLGFGAAVLAIVFLNPGLVENFVVDGHNDLAAIALVVAAMSCAKRNVPIAFVLALGAGLIKAQYGVMALLTFAALPALRARLSLTALLAVAIAAVSIIGGGRAYAGALVYHAGHHGMHSAGITSIAHALAALIALGATGLAVARRRWLEGVEWTLPALTVATYSWYAVGALAYVAGRRAGLAAVLVILPLIMWNMDYYFNHTLMQRAIVVLVVVLVLARLAPARRTLRASPTGP